MSVTLDVELLVPPKGAPLTAYLAFINESLTDWSMRKAIRGELKVLVRNAKGNSITRSSLNLFKTSTILFFAG